MNTQPSVTERANLLVVGGLISFLSLTNILVVNLHPIFDPPKSKISFGISDPGPAPFSLGHFLALGLFIVVFLTKRRYIGGFLYSVVCLLPFLVELARAYHVLYHHDIIYTQSFLSVLQLIGNPLDFLVTLVLVFVCAWLLSLAIRPLIQIRTVPDDATSGT